MKYMYQTGFLPWSVEQDYFLRLLAMFLYQVLVLIVDQILFVAMSLFLCQIFGDKCQPSIMYHQLGITEDHQPFLCERAANWITTNLDYREDCRYNILCDGLELNVT